MAKKSAGLILIADGGHNESYVRKNSQILTKRLFTAGVRVQQISIIENKSDFIADKVINGSKTYNCVIICQVGDVDFDYDGIARATGEPLVFNDDLSKILNGTKRNAMIPKSAKVLDVASGPFPIVQVSNIFVLPDILAFSGKVFSVLKLALAVEYAETFSTSLKVKGDKKEAVNWFEKIKSEIGGEVWNETIQWTFPDESDGCLIALESRTLDELMNARLLLQNVIPRCLIDSTLNDDDALTILDLAEGESTLSKSIANSLEIINRGIKTYGSQATTLSFNGGKDCTVLLHLLWAAFHSSKNKPIRTMYVRCQDPFQEIDDFIEECVPRYELELETLPGPIKPALESLVSTHPEIQAVWLGTRRTDPYSDSLNYMQMCDADWPQIMRINPLLDWSYDDIWKFLRLLSVPYCKLYDDGYTSLGHRKNTQKNPLLFDSATETYKPAYKLEDGSQERLGRM